MGNYFSWFYSVQPENIPLTYSSACSNDIAHLMTSNEKSICIDIDLYDVNVLIDTIDSLDDNIKKYIRYVTRHPEFQLVVDTFHNIYFHDGKNQIILQITINGVSDRSLSIDIDKIKLLAEKSN
jgi:hypothetical protein